MRKLIFSAFVAFWSVLATLLLLHALAPEAGTDRQQPAEDSDRNAAEDEPPRYALSDIALHAALDDCWIAVEGQVYDITDYIPRHPAPDDVLQAWCGRDATEGMRTKGKNRDHSARAWRMLERYRIGSLATSGTSAGGS